MSPFSSSMTFCVLCFASICVSVLAGPGGATTHTLNDGNKMPAFGLGTAVNLKKWPPETVAVTVTNAIDAGYRLFDTAAIYGNEEQIGRVIVNKTEDRTVIREDLFLITKLWNTKHAKDEVVPTLRESLERLKLDYVDLYLMHFPMAYTPEYKILNIDYLETWKGMEEAKKMGLAKSIGVCNFNEQQLTRLLENSQIKPAVLQIEVNPNLTQKKLVELAQNNSVVVMAHCPFGSFVGGRANRTTLAPKIDDPILTAIANKYGKTTPQIVLRYLVDLGIVPIPKTIHQNRLEENINIFDFHLTEDEVKTIDEFNRDYRSNPDSHFSQHPDYPFEKIAEPRSLG